MIIGFVLYAILSILILFIFIRFISSWFVFTRKTFLGFVQRVTDPVLLPVQRLIPPIGMFDISAMIVLIVIQLLQDAVLRMFLFLIRFTEKNNAIYFTVRVVPRASKSEIAGEMGGALKVRIARRRLTARQMRNS